MEAPLNGEHYAAPTAQMFSPTATSSRLSRPEGQYTSKTTPKEKDRAVDAGPSSSRPPREDADLWAEVDRVEQNRDRRDPDCDASGPYTSRNSEKRKRTSTGFAQDQEQTAPSKRPRATRQNHVLYSKCGAVTQQTRDRHLRRIRENWGVSVGLWMPPDMIPTRKVKGAKGGPDRRLLEPRDWSNALLEELAYFSGVTQNRPAQALATLQASMARSERVDEIPEPLQTDVRYAIQVHEQEQARVQSRSPTTPSNTNRRRSEVGNALSEPVTAPPPTGNDPTIKQEADVNVPANTWNIDDEEDKLREYELRRDATKAALDFHLQNCRIRKRMRERQRVQEHANRPGGAIPL
ncbi:uncharacterized protein LTR77_009547 [Saxophila tyrrhenica]|uniref:Uncharacterized protein n=1 Tax=Saxophila tyrrhenica TaxID=1690608 RepID=A0AAV9NY99_9PEZI|nr:hypothetical protein LTR77_009547 [Saxophila tyrrhenica]